jgi:hypothetical protein
MTVIPEHLKASAEHIRTAYERLHADARRRALNARIDTAHRNYRHLPPPRPMTPGERALNSVAAAFPDKLLVMHQNADGEYTRLDVVDGGAVLASVESSAWREDAAQDAK